MSREQKLRAELVQTHRHLYEIKFGVGNDGNSSVRLNTHEILMTPKGFQKHKLTSDDISKIDLRDQSYSSEHPEPSSERKIHIQSYLQNEKIQALVHSHPPHAIACSLCGISLEDPILPEVIIILGPVPTCKYTLPGTEKIAQQVAQGFQNGHKALIMERHGVIAEGKSLSEALARMETVEHSAKILMIAASVKAPTAIKGKDLEDLQKLHDEVHAS